MSIVARHYTYDRSKLPLEVDELRIRFIPQLLESKRTILMLYPYSEPSLEPSYVRYAVGMDFRHVLMDERTLIVAQGVGQLVVTGQRLLGMITDGSVGKTILQEEAGSAYAFSLDWDDIHPIEIKKNWRGKPMEAVIQSKVGQAPPFGLKVIMVRLVVNDDGRLLMTSLPTFLEQITPEGRRNLQKKA